jgi:cold shock CspA family protein
MPTGTVKWFNHQIGAGFIRSDEGENVFFRLSALGGDDPQKIRRGQCVRFDIATDLRTISPTAASVKTCESWQ